MRGIYVVILRDGCRVAPLTDYDGLFDGYSESMIKYIHRDNFVNAFGFCVPMTEKEAIDCAKVMAKGYGEMCDGIRILTDYRNFTFQEIRDGAYSKG